MSPRAVYTISKTIIPTNLFLRLFFFCPFKNWKFVCVWEVAWKTLLFQIMGKLEENWVKIWWWLGEHCWNWLGGKFGQFWNESIFLIRPTHYMLILKPCFCTISQLIVKFKYSLLYHKGEFLFQKKQACQAFSMILLKRPPWVLLKQATLSHGTEYFSSPEELLHKILDNIWMNQICTFALNTNFS